MLPTQSEKIPSLPHHLLRCIIFDGMYGSRPREIGDLENLYTTNNISIALA